MAFVPLGMLYLAELGGINFSDSDSAPVPKFFNPDPGPGGKIFQI